MGILDTVKKFAVRTLDGSLFPTRLPDVHVRPDAVAAVVLVVLVGLLAWRLTLPACRGRSPAAWCFP